MTDVNFKLLAWADYIKRYLVIHCVSADDAVHITLSHVLERVDRSPQIPLKVLCLITTAEGHRWETPRLTESMTSKSLLWEMSSHPAGQLKKQIHISELNVTQRIIIFCRVFFKTSTCTVTRVLAQGDYRCVHPHRLAYSFAQHLQPKYRATVHSVIFI